MLCYNYDYVYTCIEAHFVFRSLMGQAGRKCVLMQQQTENRGSKTGVFLSGRLLSIEFNMSIRPIIFKFNNRPEMRTLPVIRTLIFVPRVSKIEGLHYNAIDRIILLS